MATSLSLEVLTLQLHVSGRTGILRRGGRILLLGQMTLIIGLKIEELKKEENYKKAMGLPYEKIIS